jgi:hypothetical protein
MGINIYEWSVDVYIGVWGGRADAKAGAKGYFLYKRTTGRFKNNYNL